MSVVFDWDNKLSSKKKKRRGVYLLTGHSLGPPGWPSIIFCAPLREGFGWVFEVVNGANLVRSGLAVTIVPNPSYVCSILWG